MLILYALYALVAPALNPVREATRGRGVEWYPMFAVSSFVFLKFLLASGRLYCLAAPRGTDRLFLVPAVICDLLVAIPPVLYIYRVQMSEFVFLLIPAVMILAAFFFAAFLYRLAKYLEQPRLASFSLDAMILSAVLPMVYGGWIAGLTYDVRVAWGFANLLIVLSCFYVIKLGRLWLDFWPRWSTNLRLWRHWSGG